MKKLVVLTGAGMSAESGIQTFRDANGLWEGHDVMEVASPQGFEQNPGLVLDFYNQRRRQLLEVHPNKGHQNLVLLEEHFDVSIITQNVDDLHERAGSRQVIHLHGELLKVQSTADASCVYDWKKDIKLGDNCEKGHQLRPAIVWFGEAVPMMEKAIAIVEKADILVIIGTSMQVYPAASLLSYAPLGIPIHFIDPNPAIDQRSIENLSIYPTTATEGTKLLINQLTP